MAASEVELLEVFRLGEAARDETVVRVVGDRLAGRWLAVSRVHEVADLTTRSLEVQVSAGRTDAGRAREGPPGSGGGRPP